MSSDLVGLPLCLNLKCALTVWYPILFDIFMWHGFWYIHLTCIRFFDTLHLHASDTLSEVSTHKCIWRFFWHIHLTDILAPMWSDTHLNMSCDFRWDRFSDFFIQSGLTWLSGMYSEMLIEHVSILARYMTRCADVIAISLGVGNECVLNYLGGGGEGYTWKK